MSELEPILPIWQKFLSVVVLLLVVEVASCPKKFSLGAFPRWKFSTLLCLQAISACALFLTPSSFWILVLWLSTFLASVHFRGAFNGGADGMLLTVLTGLSVAVLFPEYAKFGVGYIAIQVALSYFVAGFVKVKRAEWRSGESLRRLLNSRYYGANTQVVGISKNAVMMKVVTWLVLVFELTFPLAILWPSLTWPYLVFGACFHLANVYLFGLNRFFWSWMAAYPAVFLLATKV